MEAAFKYEACRVLIVDWKPVTEVPVHKGQAMSSEVYYRSLNLDSHKENQKRKKTKKQRRTPRTVLAFYFPENVP